MSKILFLFLFLSTVVWGQDERPIPQKKTICLNMIVKNESEVIEKCLASVKPFIDYWVIVDTGSKDGTQEVVKSFLKDVPGELLEKPWVNFAHNRNEALAAAKDKADYLLFLDADEVWQYADNFALPALERDAYFVRVRQLGVAEFKRVGIANAHLEWEWKGILHEHIDCLSAKTFSTLNGVYNVCNEMKGARSKNPDTHLKDIDTFKNALKEDPKNSRYMFYLGQSYMFAEKYDLALEAYEKRNTMVSPDIQETYLSLYQTGIAQESLNDPDQAIKSYFKAYQFRPTRAEPLFRAAMLHRKQGNYLLGYLLSKFALAIPVPTEDICFEYLTYDYALLVEYANCALLLGRFKEGFEACSQLLANPNLPSNIKPQVLANLELARNKLDPVQR